MRTLAFCTAFAGARDLWQLRYRRWLDAVRTTGLQADQVLIVDDGSSTLPDWQDATLVTEGNAADPEHFVCSDPVVVFHFASHLGRKAIHDFPGWYRSFAFAARYADAQGFDKVIHLESDAYLISPRLVRYANSVARGWNVLWCPQYNVPEMAIQFIAGQEITTLAAVFRQDYGNLIGRHHETMLPYTRVVRSFIGDRFGDYGLWDIPRDVDYAAQVDIHREPAYYWWLSASRSSDISSSVTATGAKPWIQGAANLAEDFTMEFRADCDVGQYLQSGWSEPEETHTWAVGAASELRLPAFPLDNYTLLLRMGAHVGERIPRQRLRIELNGRRIAELEAASELKLGIELPSGALNQIDANLLRFIHPDAAVPSASDDSRSLSIALMTLALRNTSRRTTSRSRSVKLPHMQCGAHIERLGQLWFMPDEWAGLRGSGLAVEGVILSPGPTIDPDEIEYSAELVDGSTTEWMRGGEFCGTQGQGVPLAGIRVRLIGDCCRRFHALLTARFIDGSGLGPFGGAELACRKAGKSLEAFRLIVLAKG
jgi:hypothetical protein